MGLTIPHLELRVPADEDEKVPRGAARIIIMAGNGGRGRLSLHALGNKTSRLRGQVLPRLRREEFKKRVHFATVESPI